MRLGGLLGLALVVGLASSLACRASTAPLGTAGLPLAETPTPTTAAAPTVTVTPTPERHPSPTARAAPIQATPVRATATPTPPARPTTVPPTPSPVARPAMAERAAVIQRGDPHRPLVALTFDIGIPTAEVIPQVLDRLRERQVRATFFITGQWAERQPALLQRLVDEGHELANHTYSHPDLTKLSEAAVRDQIERTEEIVQRLTGRSTRPYFRPPFGAYDARILALVAQMGYHLVYWSRDAGDWQPAVAPAEISRRVGEQTRAGDIVVFHAYVPKTAAVLPEVIQRLRARGLQPVRLSELLAP